MRNFMGYLGGAQSVNAAARPVNSVCSLPLYFLSRPCAGRIKKPRGEKE
jgi:hypothetical protein